MINVGLVSLGCPKNLVDSEVILAYLDTRKITICEDLNEAHIIIINTCCFIDEAYNESIEVIKKVARLKKYGSCTGIIVCGCLVEKERKKLFSLLPEIDALLGTHNQSQIRTAIDHILCKKRYSSIQKQKVRWHEESLVKLTPLHFAYVKIADGCQNNCTFCIIPQLRGPYISRPFHSIIHEVEQLALQGTKEIILVGQDTTQYGYDLADEYLIEKLLSALSDIASIKWIRLLYTYPGSVTHSLLKTIAASRTICNYIDLPLQHISDRILKRMGRRDGSSEIRKLIYAIRDTIGDVAIRTTFIVGFPGETDKDFQILLDFMNEVRFERLGIFMYSPQKGTPSYTYKEGIPENIKQERFEQAMLLQQDISREINKTFFGKNLEVIIDGVSEEDDSIYLARTEYDSPEVDGIVYVNARKKQFKQGDLVSVQITDTKEYDLVGIAAN
ncbi:30S ribosomal protein S12 methylthiotransferase RimO [Chlamydiota bacterium]